MNNGPAAPVRRCDRHPVNEGQRMDIFLLSGKDPNDEENPEKTWIVVAEREVDARKLLPAQFEVFEVENRTGDLG